MAGTSKNKRNSSANTRRSTKNTKNYRNTKSKKRGDRGLGLYRAKMIAEKAGGEITVGQEEIGGENYLQFAVVI